VAVEVAIYVWMPTWLQDYHGSYPWLATYALTVFFGLRAAGRFLGVWLLDRLRWDTVLTVLALAILLCFAGSLVGGTGQLATSNLTCDVQSASIVVVPALISCTAALGNSLAPGANGTVTVTIKTTSGTVTASASPSARPGSMRALYALSFGMPAVVFIGLAGPLGAIRRKKTFRGKAITWLGLVLLVALLSMSIGCGGGFSNPNNLGPVTIQRTVPGSYTAVVTYQDASNNKQVLATLPFTVN